MTLFGDSKLAVAQGIPQLDCAIARAGDDLTVVGREGHGEDIVGMADEAAGCHTSCKLPQTKGLVPGGGESVGTVGRDDLGNRRVSTNASRYVEARGVRSQKRCVSGRVGSALGNRSAYRRE